MRYFLLPMMSAVYTAFVVSMSLGEHYYSCHEIIILRAALIR